MRRKVWPLGCQPRQQRMEEKGSLEKGSLEEQCRKGEAIHHCLRRFRHGQASLASHREDQRGEDGRRIPPVQDQLVGRQRLRYLLGALRRLRGFRGMLLITMDRQSITCRRTSLLHLKVDGRSHKT